MSVHPKGTSSLVPVLRRALFLHSRIGLIREESDDDVRGVSLRDRDYNSPHVAE